MIEIRAFTKHIRQRIQENEPFVVYRHPGGEVLKAWFPKFAEIKRQAEVMGSGFVFSPFDPGSTSVLFPLRVSEIVEIHLTDGAKILGSESVRDKSGSKESKKSTGVIQNSVDGGISAREKHLKLVQNAIDQIAAGKASKIVVSRREEIGGLEIDPIDVFYDLVDSYPQAFAYLWYHPEVGMWCGASPEKLLSIENRTFQTMSLAGTQVYKGDDEVVWGAKEVQEQQMVTDMIEKEMKGLLSRVGSSYTQRAGNLLHLRTDLEGEIPVGVDPSELISRLHPTAAVCGMPRDTAFEFIFDSEGYSREYYTGFLGEIAVPRGLNSKLFVNLRCMRLFPEEKKVWIYIGGGITAESDPEKEWEETVSKSKTMKRVFS